jgi:hypothetical protein
VYAYAHGAAIYRSDNGFASAADVSISAAAGAGARLVALRPHPRAAALLLAEVSVPACFDGSGAPCRNAAYVSLNAGASWALVMQYVQRADWAAPYDAAADGSAQARVLVHGWLGRDGQPQALLRLADSVLVRVVAGEADGAEVLASAVASFRVQDTSESAAGGDALFVSVVLDDSGATAAGAVLDMRTSPDGADQQPLSQARFPFDTAAALVTDFELVDAAENMSVIALSTVYGSPLWGDAYYSGPLDRDYVLSLQNTRRDSGTHRVDFYPVASLGGVYLANAVANVDNEPEKPGDLQLVTRISFTKGFAWEPLPAPAFDANGDRTFCSLADGCSLHLASATSVAPIASDSTAVGVIIASGNLGQYLDQRQDALHSYISRDGGVSWTEAAQGLHEYAVSDHGVFALMGPRINAGNSVMFSSNEGINWTVCSFTNGSMYITDVHAAPAESLHSFLVTGYVVTDSGRLTGAVVLVDMLGNLTRSCTQDDFEWWSPTDMSGSPCLLGRQMRYERRKADAACYVSQANLPSSEISVCQCTRTDFECDFCFELAANNLSCVLACPDYNPKLQPATCNGEWFESMGYRRLPLDLCSGGLDLSPVRHDCPDSGSHSFATIFLSLGLMYVMICFVIALVLFTCIGVCVLLFFALVAHKRKTMADDDDGLDMLYDPGVGSFSVGEADGSFSSPSAAPKSGDGGSVFGSLDEGTL